MFGGLDRRLSPYQVTLAPLATTTGDREWMPAWAEALVPYGATGVPTGSIRGLGAAMDAAIGERSIRRQALPLVVDLDNERLLRMSA